jgi:hypothetical protein
MQGRLLIRSQLSPFASEMACTKNRNCQKLSRTYVFQEGFASNPQQFGHHHSILAGYASAFTEEVL